MFSVPISIAVVALLKLLGVQLTAAQTAGVVAGTIIGVKVIIGLCAVGMFGPQLMAKLKKPAAPEPPTSTEPPKPAE